MIAKLTLRILLLVALSGIFALKLFFFSEGGTTVTIRNNTNQAIENLVFASIDHKEGYSIDKIDPRTNM